MVGGAPSGGEGEVGEGSILTKVDISNILIWVGYVGGGVGDKMVDTFEKMDAINPTFDRVGGGRGGGQ